MPILDLHQKLVKSITSFNRRITLKRRLTGYLENEKRFNEAFSRAVVTLGINVKVYTDVVGAIHYNKSTYFNDSDMEIIANTRNNILEGDIASAISKAIFLCHVRLDTPLATVKDAELIYNF